MGQPKQLLKHNEANLIQHVVDEALAAGAQKVLVVLGSDGEKISVSINKSRVTILHNEKWKEGIASSIRVGVEQAKLQSPPLMR